MWSLTGNLLNIPFNILITYHSFFDFEVGSKQLMNSQGCLSLSLSHAWITGICHRALLSLSYRTMALGRKVVPQCRFFSKLMKCFISAGHKYLLSTV